ncbi:MAG: DUF3015 family protein [Thermodesulfobacteriota bacterium]
MKKIALVVLICFMTVGFASVCMAQQGGVKTVREDCGCGLGGMALGEKTGLIWKLVGTFLNGISGNQTFAMTSGTLDCGQVQSLAMNEQLNTYVSDNMDSLAVDISQGQGESLDALAEIANVPETKRPALYGELQQNFDRIYISSDVTHETVVNEISQIIQTI